MLRTLVRLPALAAPIVAGLALATAASVAPLAPVAGTCAGAGPNHAAVLVEHADGGVVSRCVAFDGAEVSGAQLFALSGLRVETQSFGGMGVAICALDGEPAHYSSCLGTDRYWALFVSKGGGAWQFASAGISSVALRDGDAEGFRYVPETGTPPAPPSPAGVCQPAAGTAAPKQTPLPVRVAATPGPAQSGAAVPASAPVSSSGVPDASPVGPPAAASAVALAAPRSTTSPATPAAERTASGSGGPDAGLVLAIVAVAALAFLALLRLLPRLGPRGRGR